MGIGTGTALLLATLLGSATAIGTSAFSASQQAAEGKRSRSAANAAAKKQSIGNLTDAEAGASASKRAFRTGLIFTSPTGVQGTGRRGGSRLFGTP